jgi:hypothetical protein
MECRVDHSFGFALPESNSDLVRSLHTYLRRPQVCKPIENHVPRCHKRLVQTCLFESGPKIVTDARTAT